MVKLGTGFILVFNLVKCGNEPARYLTWGGEGGSLLFCVGHTMDCVWCRLGGSLLLFFLLSRVSRKCNGVCCAWLRCIGALLAHSVLSEHTLVKICVP